MRIRLSEEDEAEVVARYRAGLSTWALARRFGVGRATIGRILDRHGHTDRRPHAPRLPVDDAEVVRLRDAGHTWAEVGALVRMSPAGARKRYWQAVSGVSSRTEGNLP